MPAVALAQDARQVEIGYEITFAGVAGFRIDVIARFNGATYDVETSTFKEGMLKAVTMNYVGRNRAWGGFSPQGARPTAGSLSIMVGDKPRTWLAQYGAGGFLQETHTPVWKPTPQQAIPDADQQGSLDPLSAALSVGLAGDAACDRTGAEQRRQAPHRHHVPQDRHGARRDDGHSRRARRRAGVRDLHQARVRRVRRCAQGSRDRARAADQDLARPLRPDRRSAIPASSRPRPFLATIRGRLLYFRERPLHPAGKPGDEEDRLSS